MDGKTYRRMTEKELRGRRVRAVFDLKTRLVRIPKGAILTITRKQGGFELKSDPCAVCGVSAYISKVSPQYVELLEEVLSGEEK